MLEETVVFPGVEIGRDCHIRRAVIDSGCRIPDGTIIGENPEEDARRFSISSGGIVAISAEMLGQKSKPTEI